MMRPQDDFDIDQHEGFQPRVLPLSFLTGGTSGQLLFRGIPYPVIIREVSARSRSQSRQDGGISTSVDTWLGDVGNPQLAGENRWNL